MSPPPSTKASGGRRPSPLLIGILATVVLIAVVGIVLLVVLKSGDSEKPQADTLESTALPSTVVPTTPATSPTIVSTTPTTLPTTIAVPTTVSTEAPTTTTTEAATEAATTKTLAAQPEATATVTFEESSESTESTEASTEPSTETSSESTEASETSTIDPKDLVKQDENDDLVSACSSVTAVPCQRVRVSNEAVTGESIAPLHYSWNVSVRNVLPATLEASLFIYANVKGNKIVVDAGEQIRQLEDVSVVDCETGETICPSALSRSADRLSLQLPSEATHTLRIHFNRYVVVDQKAAMYSQVPPKWDRTAPTLLGSLFSSRKAHHILPCVDSPRSKATVDICVKHTPSQQIRGATSNSSEECLTRTPPLSPHQISLLVSQDAQLIDYPASSSDDVTLPAIDVIHSHSRGFKREKYEWIAQQAKEVLSLMTQWTRLNYPLPKLTIVSANIPETQSTCLGMITLQARVVQHGYVAARLGLARAVISQWLGGVTTTAEWRETCVQESLVTYLEWRVSESLSLGNRSRASEAGKTRGEAARDRLVEGKCSPDAAAIFHSLDAHYGHETTTKMIASVLHSHAFSSASLDDWASTAQQITGKPEAASLIREWFTRVGRPVVSVRISPTQVTLTQMNGTWTLPMEISGSSSLPILLSSESQSFPFSSTHYVIVDPKRASQAVILYDVDAYLRLIRCFDDTRCPSTRSELSAVFGDLVTAIAWPVVNDDVANAPKWRSLFKWMAQRIQLPGEAARCCVPLAAGLPASPDCVWVNVDTCSRSPLVSLLTQN